MQPIHKSCIVSLKRTKAGVNKLNDNKKNMEELLIQIRKLQVKKEVVNHWIHNPNYTGFPPTKLLSYEPYEIKMVKLDEVIKLIEEHGTL